MRRPPDIHELVRQGVACIAATADAERRPAITRGWGPVLSGDGAELTLCLEAPPGSATLANLTPGRPIAVTMSRPSTFTTAKVVGLIVEHGAADEEALAQAAEHVSAFVLDAGLVGLDAAAGHTFCGPGLHHVRVRIGATFDQTPRPGAGARL